MTRAYTVTNMKQDELERQKKEIVKIANEYIVAGQLNPDEDIKNIVLSIDDDNQLILNRITSAYNTAENITPSVAKAVLPGVVANVKILQEATTILANQSDELEQELNIVTEQKNELQTRLEGYENHDDISRMLDKIRQERETQIRLQPKKSQADIVKKQLEKAVRRKLQQK